MQLPIVSHALLVAAVATASGLPAQGNSKPAPFWQSTAPFEMTLTVNLKKVSEKCLGRSTIAFGPCDDPKDSAPWMWAAVMYVDGGSMVTLPARVRARGVSRFRICDLIPPLWVDFNGAGQRAFDGIHRFKLVMPCKAAPEFERYVIEEYNLYRLHSLMTPVTHLTRMILLTVVDSASKKAEFTKYAFAVEDVEELAARLGAKRSTLTGATVDHLQTHQTALIGVLEYMIGNTDFSISALHNVDLVAMNGNLYPIATDFDQAGVIAPPYAKPDPRLGIKSVRERVYRGLCLPADTIARVLADLREKRPAITALYTDDIGKLIGGNGASESIKWFDDFYSDVSNPSAVKSQILDKCRTAR
jgi:hypothetical protein